MIDVGCKAVPQKRIAENGQSFARLAQANKAHSISACAYGAKVLLGEGRVATEQKGKKIQALTIGTKRSEKGKARHSVKQVKF